MKKLIIIFALLIVCSASGAIKENGIPDGNETVVLSSPQYTGKAVYLILALSELQQGNLDSSDQLVAAALYYKPDDEQLYLNYIKELVANGHYEHMQKFITQFKSLKIQNYDLDFARVEYLLSSGLVSEALTEVSKLINLYPDSVDLKMLQFELLMKSGDEKNAIDTLNKYILNFPDSFLMKKYYVDYLLENNMDSKALHSINKFRLSLNEVFDLKLHVVRHCLLQSDDAEKALHIMEEIIESSDLSIDIARQCVAILMLMNESERAIEVAKNGIETNPLNNDFHILLGNVFLFLDNHIDAEKELAFVLEQKSAAAQDLLSYVEVKANLYPEIFNSSAQSKELIVHRSEVRSALTKATKSISYQDTRELFYLGFYYQELSEFRKSLMPLEYVTYGDKYSKEAFKLLSMAYSELNDQDSLISSLEMAITKFPDDPFFLNNLGYFYADLGEKLELAKALLEQALLLAPGDPSYLDSMGWISFKLGDLPKAFDYLIRASNAMPDNPVILEHLGVCLEAMGEEEKALIVFQRALSAGGNKTVLNELIEKLGEK